MDPEHAENPENPGVIQQILHLLQQQTAHLQQQQEQQQQQRADPVVTFKIFQSVNPPEFKGSKDPVVARTWLKEI